MLEDDVRCNRVTISPVVRLLLSINGLCCVLRDVSMNVAQRSDVQIVHDFQTLSTCSLNDNVRVVDRDSETSNNAHWTDADAANVDCVD